MAADEPPGGPERVAEETAGNELLDSPKWISRLARGLFSIADRAALAADIDELLTAEKQRADAAERGAHVVPLADYERLQAKLTAAEAQVETLKSDIRGMDEHHRRTLAGEASILATAKAEERERIATYVEDKHKMGRKIADYIRAIRDEPET